MKTRPKVCQYGELQTNHCEICDRLFIGIYLVLKLFHFYRDWYFLMHNYKNSIETASLFTKLSAMKIILWRCQNSLFLLDFPNEWININNINKHIDHHFHTRSKINEIVNIIHFRSPSTSNICYVSVILSFVCECSSPLL